jgi:alpha-galactosidase
MGFNDWNAFGCSVSETLIEQTADVFVSSGLKAAGYTFVNIDDCWAMRDRGPDGRLVPDPVKFPSGIQGVADYVHSKGLKLGIYGDAGTKTCAGYPGSLGVEQLDAQTWADWGVDYVKYDNCFNLSDGTQANFIARYTAMRDALQRTGRPMVYSISEWGQSQPWQWAPGVGNLWRTTGDINDSWISLRTIIAFNITLAQFAGPGHWNDPDMLEIGNGGMTATEYRTHMSMWAMMAAPLIIGTDLRNTSAENLAILGNKDVIAIDQDRLGQQAAVVANSQGVIVLDKPLASGDHAIALYNSTDALTVVSVPAGQTGLRPARAYQLRDVWTGNELQARATIAAGVPAHGTVIYLARPSRDPDDLPPAVAVGASVATLIPGIAGGATLTTTAVNRGVGAARDVQLSVQAPAGWSVTASTPTRKTLASDAGFSATWNVRVPDGTAAGRYPLTVTASYAWGERRQRSASAAASELIGVVVIAPLDGTSPLSTVLPVSSSNAVGPVELDQSNGGVSQGDGNLITIGGTIYTRGLGTAAPSEIQYYVGGRCSALTTGVGLDDDTATGSATFTISADNAAIASATVAAGGGVQPLTADLTGATWLTLTTTSSDTTGGMHADWVAPQLVCGTTADPTVVDTTIFSFETGTDGFTTANVDPISTMTQTAGFHTDGGHGLEVFSPVDGDWYGRTLDPALDLTGKTMLKYDVQTGSNGTSNEFALQVGPDLMWCQGGLWSWTNPNSSQTVTRKLSQITCPAGAPLDVAQIRAVWVFLKDGTFRIDNVRAE